MNLSIEQVKALLKQIHLDQTPWYSKERGLKFFWHPVHPMRWNEVFVLFEGEERVGLAVADHDRFELYCSDDAVGQAFLNNIPAVWFGELVCAGYYLF